MLRYPSKHLRPQPYPARGQLCDRLREVGLLRQLVRALVALAIELRNFRNAYNVRKRLPGHRFALQS